MKRTRHFMHVENLQGKEIDLRAPDGSLASSIVLRRSARIEQLRKTNRLPEHTLPLLSVEVSAV